ncbi:MAG TPA: hypothetical protein VN376_03400 [Longilinea sp.]|nr:hypothetical protein [Longilinea sp.]
MKKWIWIAVLLLSIVTLTACNGADTTYRQGLSTALDNYITWNEGIYTTYHDLLSVPSNGVTDVTYGDLIMGTMSSYMTEGQAGITPQDSWDPIDIEIFQGTVQMMVEEGTQVLSELQALTPVDSMTEQHQTLVDCMTYRVGVGQIILRIFTEGVYTPLEISSSACENIEQVIAELQTYAGN